MKRDRESDTNPPVIDPQKLPEYLRPKQYPGSRADRLRATYIEEPAQAWGDYMAGYEGAEI